MQKLLLCFLTALFLSCPAFAIPAKRTPRIVTQPDGTQLTVIMYGDESFHWYQTTDGIPVVTLDDGSYRYARVENGVLVATPELAHEAGVRTLAENAFIKAEVASLEETHEIARVRRANLNKLRAQRASQKKMNRVGEPVGAIGDFKGLVILVNFQDVKMSYSDAQKRFDDMMNKEGYNDNGNSCSVHDYFKEQSYNQFNVKFDVVGPVTVSGPMAQYGKNEYDGSDRDPAKMVYEACKLADPYVDYKNYDWNNDGEVDNVYLIYAGYSEAEGGPKTSIWPHEFALEWGGYRLTCDGMKINTYGCSSELTGSIGNRLDGIGTACHEFSHCLGLPDFYDTQGDRNFGLDIWSLMDYGCYAGDGYAPVGYTSYERMFSGWLKPTELKEATAIKNMKPISTAPEAYIIYNEADKDEFYMIENRQKVNSDSELPGHGMLVLHVDFDKRAWGNNSVNTDMNHQRCTIIAADNNYAGGYYNTLDGDPFPGTENKTELTDDSMPAAVLYNANSDGKRFMHKPITQITENADQTISFSFMGGLESGIDQVINNELGANAMVNIYNAAGQHMGQSTYGAFMQSNQPAGVYLLHTGKGVIKVVR